MLQDVVQHNEQTDRREDYRKAIMSIERLYKELSFVSSSYNGNKLFIASCIL